tara:strand:+ start:4238 stop:4852 length:615 start_codon:yes stop_codon:yes gene_type:complete
MIINIRGTSGSGKSTIVTQLMKRYTVKQAIFTEGRKQPLGYKLDKSDITRRQTGVSLQPMFVIGHYESPCGGCDTISSSGSQDKIWELIRDYHTQKYHVLFEGAIIGDDRNRTNQAHLDGLPLLLIELDVSLEECLKSIQIRRAARGVTKLVNPHNTTKRFKRIHSRMKKFKTFGIDVRVLNREEAFKQCLDALSLPWIESEVN